MHHTCGWLDLQLIIAKAFVRSEEEALPLSLRRGLPLNLVTSPNLPATAGAIICSAADPFFHRPCVCMSCAWLVCPAFGSRIDFAALAMRSAVRAAQRLAYPCPAAGALAQALEELAAQLRQRPEVLQTAVSDLTEDFISHRCGLPWTSHKAWMGCQSRPCCLPDHLPPAQGILINPQRYMPCTASSTRV